MELHKYHRSLVSGSKLSSQSIRDAVEFTRLAAKRWRYYAGNGETAENLAELRQAIGQNKHAEVAFIFIASTRIGKRLQAVGLAYCRRTWCHHLALDFLALHPRALSEQSQISGVGSGIVHGIVRLAKSLRVRRIWGEATLYSAPFYECLLALTPVHDLFIIESREMAVIQKRQAKTGRRGLPQRPGEVQ